MTPQTTRQMLVAASIAAAIALSGALGWFLIILAVRGVIDWLWRIAA